MNLIHFSLIYTEADYFENFNLDTIVILVNTKNLLRLLVEVNYDKQKTEWLVNSFEHGFDLCYKGNRDQQRNAPNLKLRIGDETDLWNKVMKEVKAKRYAGPFEKVPFECYVQSPIGLVPKDGGRST